MAAFVLKLLYLHKSNLQKIANAISLVADLHSQTGVNDLATTAILNQYYFNKVNNH